MAAGPSVPSTTSTRPCSAATSVIIVKNSASTGTRSAGEGTR
ncbi:MAG TPA: hypothetical protein VH573_08830 [Mycobacteriales bacterium]